MTTLDARARRAAHAINAGVAEFTPAATFDAVVLHQQRWRTFQAAFAGAVTAILVILIGINAVPSPTPEVAVTQTTLPPTTVPTTQPVVPPPVVVTTTEAPQTTTTTTAAPEQTTTTTTTTTTTLPPDTTPPELVITSPKNEERFEVDVIEFRGVTEPGASVFAGRYEADVDREGNWSIRLVLSPGANGALFVATDAAGNSTEARVTVYYDVPEPTTTTTTKPPKEFEFTAYQQYGSCEETPPYDVFWGTAPPGTPIYVESEYGSGSTETRENGEWEIKVFFPEAPADKVFAVKVKDNAGHKKWFEFVHYV
jgi:hypothetical protein